MNARVKKRDTLSKRQMQEIDALIREEYDRVVAIDASSSENHELMSHIDQNLDRLGYHFPHEDPEKWVVQ